ncbi:MAG: Sporulation protein YunB (Spo YunB) [Oscillospiraceae bacterium]|jgi:sporulation protein YunB|nr:Sporulation protein YunB (Spo YunB) [Oscillospiraceae bacterium]
MRSKKSRSSVFLRKFLFSVFALISAILFVDMKIRPVVKTVAQYQGSKITSSAINKSVKDAISKSDVDFENLVSISYNNSGDISSVKTNIKEIDRLQSEISLSVNSSMDEISDDCIEIPLGTFSGISLLNGRGPVFKFKIKPVGFVSTQLKSEFISAGINQTLHKITLNVGTSATAVVPGANADFDVNFTYVVAETVIVGKIPESYTYVTGDERDSLTKANDYKSNG